MSKEILEAFRILEEDKGIKKEDIIDAVVESLRSAYRRRYGQSAVANASGVSGSITTWTMPSRSRKSIKITPPWSRRRCTPQVFWATSEVVTHMP